MYTTIIMLNMYIQTIYHYVKYIYTRYITMLNSLTQTVIMLKSSRFTCVSVYIIYPTIYLSYMNEPFNIA